MTGPVFIFTCGGDMDVFQSLIAAEQWMEVIGVEEGEYVAVYLTDGARYLATVEGERVRLMPSGDLDLANLQQRLGDYKRRVSSAPQALSPATFAAEWLRWKQERRWSSRLRRLLRRRK